MSVAPPTTQQHPNHESNEQTWRLSASFSHVNRLCDTGNEGARDECTDDMWFIRSKY